MSEEKKDSLAMQIALTLSWTVGNAFKKCVEGAAYAAGVWIVLHYLGMP